MVLRRTRGTRRLEQCTLFVFRRLKIVKLPRLSRRMPKINPMRTRRKLPCLSSYGQSDVKLRHRGNFPLGHGNLTGPTIGDILPVSHGEFLIPPQKINPSADTR